MPRYTASCAAFSWIDQATGLPEHDGAGPPETVSRGVVTGNAGYRFCNFIDVWVDYDPNARTIVGHGYSNEDGIYRAPSFAKIPSHAFPVQHTVAVGSEPVAFTQICGARTQSPEVIGTGAGVVGGAAAIGGAVWLGILVPPVGAVEIIGGAVIVVGGGVVGNRAAHAVSGFPPIWSELRISIFNDGRPRLEILRHSLFPSLTFFTPDASTPNLYRRTALPGGAPYYDAKPELERWKKEGWGPIVAGTTTGKTAGNPWNYTKW